MDRTGADPGMLERVAARQVPPGSAALWWLGQASFIVKGGGLVVYVDPYLHDSPRRLSPPPFAAEAVTNADVVLLTHDHSDHVDPVALPGVAAASPQARIVAPRPIVARVAALVGGADRVTAAAADEPLRLKTGAGALELLPTPAAHEGFDRAAGGDYPYLGYTLRLGGVTIHHTGDTVPYDGQIERLRSHGIDLLLVPINGRDYYRTRDGIIGNMDYREAGELATAVGARLVVPMHYGMFDGNTVPPGHFVSYLAEKHPEMSVHVPGRFGELVYTT